MNINFFQYDLHSQNSCSKGSFDCCQWNTCSYAHTFIPQMEKFFCNVKNFMLINWFDGSKERGAESWVLCCVYFAVSTIMYFIYQQPTLTYTPFISVVCCIPLIPRFHCCSDCLLQHSHMTSYMYCVISYTVTHSYKIPLFPCYLFCHSFVCVMQYLASTCACQ
jgi:hypothetical protein